MSFRPLLSLLQLPSRRLTPPSRGRPACGPPLTSNVSSHGHRIGQGGRVKNIATAVVLTIFALLPTGTVQAQAQAQISTTTHSGAQTKAEPAQEAQLQALQVEIQVMKEFTQHILSTVYFALGTVVVVLFAMIGFGWYQNVRVYERDKEALRQSLLAALKEETAKGFEDLNDRATERFKSFDENMAKALERTHLRLADVQLRMEAAVFHAAHAPKTPRTDFLVFSDQIDRSIGRVSPGVLDHALSTVLDHVVTADRIDSATRTNLLTLATKVAVQNPVFGERLRETLAGKPE